MGNKRLKKRAYSLKGLSRRGLSLLMAMVMTLSLVQISAFATDGEESKPDTLVPGSLEDKNGHGITLSKTAQRVDDTEWEVTVKADIGETPIKQQPLEVVFVIDRSGSMNWCTEEEHDQGSHEHDWWCYQEVWVEDDSWFGGHYERQLTCTKPEVKHGERGSDNLCVPCQYKDSDGKWKNYETRMEATKTAVGNLVSSLPKGTEVTYVSYTTKGWNWDRPDINVRKDLNSLNLTPTGNTNTNEGMQKGIEQFTTSGVSKKILVLLTDGEVSNGYSYTSGNYDTFDGAVYTVGFAFNSDKLASVAKNGGSYIYAKDANTLKDAFKDLATRIAAMIVDPMGDEVTYVSDSAQDKGTTQGIITQDGNTLRWIPANQTEFSNSTIEYTYRVKLTPSKENGDYTDIKLNNTTYLQYGVEQNGVKTAYTANFPIPAGYYKVSTLEEQFKVLDENGNASEITDSVRSPTPSRARSRTTAIPPWTCTPPSRPWIPTTSM